MRVACKRGVIAGVLVILAAMLPLDTVHALPRYGPLEVTGSLSAQQLFRTPDIDQWQFIQQRNTFKLRVDYKALNEGKLVSRFSVGDVFDEIRLFVLYRGVYDSVYSYFPTFKQHDVYGLPVQTVVPGTDPPATRPLTLRDLGNHDELQFENTLREAYIDFGFKEVPLSFRVGRQMIVWGETDSFRLLDRVNALDLTWHLQQESWDEIRRPYWMIKGLYSIPHLGPLTDTFFEFYWNPGDWYPGKRAFIEMPWSVPITDPLGLAFDAFNGFLCPAQGTQVNPVCPINQLYNGTRLFTQGDYSRTPGQNSQAGIRFSGVTPQGIQGTIAYFYSRWPGDDGTNTAAFQGILDADQANAALARGQLPIEAIFPYVHAFGLSGNYSDEDLTQTVYRLESTYELGVPFLDASKTFEAGTNPIITGILGQDVFGVSKRDMWKGMVGFDRPTWIRALNRRTTIFLSGQFFWHYLLDNPSPGCSNEPGTGPCLQNRGFRGGLSLSPLGATSLYASRGITPGPGGATPWIDKVRDWEALVTLAATTFYKGGSIVPFVVYILDPVNSFNQEIIWTLDYYITNNLIANVGQRYFVRAGSAPAFESWGVGGVNRGRSETQLRLTYQY